MNKSELVKALADQANISLDEATLVVNTFVDSMKDSLLEGGRVEIRGFGSFKVKEYGSYAGRNPRTGEKVAVEPKRLPFFRAGKELKQYLNVKTSRRCPGEPASPGFLVLCLLLFSFIGTAAASELFPEGEGLRTAPELSVSATAQPILRILYAADSHGALHPCPS